jgi:hypothetical protein
MSEIHITERAIQLKKSLWLALRRCIQHKFEVAHCLIERIPCRQSLVGTSGSAEFIEEIIVNPCKKVRT